MHTAGLGAYIHYTTESVLPYKVMAATNECLQVLYWMWNSIQQEMGFIIDVLDGLDGLCVIHLGPAVSGLDRHMLPGDLCLCRCWCTVTAASLQSQVWRPLHCADAPLPWLMS